MYVFHRGVPVFSSSANMLPRKVQHGYAGLPASASSSDATPTYTLPAATVADCVMIAAGWVSARVFHRSLPVRLSKASTQPPGPPPGTKIEPWVPTITAFAVTTGVARALSNGTPVAEAMLVAHFSSPVFLSTAYN